MIENTINNNVLANMSMSVMVEIHSQGNRCSLQKDWKKHL